MVLYIKRQYDDKTLTLRKCMYMRASGASELRKFLHFHILKLLFLSIFCLYFIYFVGKNDMLFGLHVPTNFLMYRQNSEKALLGGLPPPPPPPPPPGYATTTFLIWVTVLKKSQLLTDIVHRSLCSSRCSSNRPF